MHGKGNGIELLTMCRLALEMPGPPNHRTIEAVKRALESGVITEAHIKYCVKDVLRLLCKTAKLDDRRVTPPEQAINLPEHQALIREAGAEGIILMKNRDHILPMDTKKTKIALLGPLAKYAAAHGGGSASLSCHYKVSPWDAFEKRYGDQVELTYSEG
jgi:beta-glucosidase